MGRGTWGLRLVPARASDSEGNVNVNGGHGGFVIDDLTYSVSSGTVVLQAPGNATSFRGTSAEYIVEGYLPDGISPDRL